MRRFKLIMIVASLAVACAFLCADARTKVSATSRAAVADGTTQPAATAAVGARISVQTQKGPFLIKEPVPLDITWENVSEKPLMIKPIRGGQGGSDGEVTVKKKDAGKGTSYGLFVTRREEIALIGYKPVSLKPGGKYRQRLWVLLGRKVGAGGPWEFIFATPGHYEVVLSRAPKQPLRVHISRPKTDEDKTASALFSEPAAKMFLGENYRTIAKVGQEALQDIFRNHAKSTYAPYAAMGMAKYLLRRTKVSARNADFPAFKNYLERIIEKHPKHVLHAEALYRLARAYLHQDNGRTKARELGLRLRKEHPDNPILPDFGKIILKPRKTSKPKG